MNKSEISQIKVFNINIQSIHLFDLLKHYDNGVLYTPNVDHLIELQVNKEFQEAYFSAEWIVCDSRIIALFWRFRAKPFRDVIVGANFFKCFYLHHKGNLEETIFLFGSSEENLTKACRKINKVVGRKMVVGYHSPSFNYPFSDEENSFIIQKINASGASNLIVGLGAPKQEIWIHQNRNNINCSRIMALGATIDFESGEISRAPKLLQLLALEWFYRLIKEPKRMFKRYIVRDSKFFYYYFLDVTGLKKF